MIAETGLNDYLMDAIDAGASDLHLTVGLSPMIRIDGQVKPLDYSPLQGDTIRETVYSILSDEQRRRLENDWELDFGYTLPEIARFRVNVYFQKGSVGAAFRVIPHEVKALDELGLPRSVEEMTGRLRGLILVTGPTGSGKSTTLASMINEINAGRREHIMSVEDPIEFIHQH